MGEHRAMSEREYPALPRVAVGAVVIKDDAILLVKRGMPPGKDLWAIPGGGLQLGETLERAAEREIMEETGVIIRARNPIYTFDFIERDDEDRIRFHYVIIDILADYIAGTPHGADDAADARWFTVKDLQTIPISQKTIHLLTKIHFIKLDK